nr:hypothetical protein [Tanacetum cinerariifolium]
MLLMQAHENGVVLDEEQLMFIVGGQDNFVDDDADEPPIQDLTMFMANLSSVDIIYDETGPSYDSDILFEVQDHDNYHDAACEHHEVYEMHNDVQPNYIVNLDADYTSDSNMILYDQYVKDKAESVVQSNVSYVLNDAYIMTINKMHEQAAQCVSANEQNKLVNASLIAELARYKEQIFWFDDIIKEKAKALKEKANNPKPITAVTMYPPNTPGKLVPKAAQCVSANEQNKLVNASLIAELARYKEQVELTFQEHLHIIPNVFGVSVMVDEYVDVFWKTLKEDIRCTNFSFIPILLFWCKIYNDSISFWS